MWPSCDPRRMLSRAMGSKPRHNQSSTVRLRLAFPHCMGQGGVAASTTPLLREASCITRRTTPAQLGSSVA